MIHGLTDSDKYLYHYTDLSTANDYIFKNWTLKMGRFSRTNDPKESKTWKFNLGTNHGRDLADRSLSQLSEELSKRIKENCSVLCFCKDTGGLTGSHTDDICLRGFAKPRIWAQYGDGHKGVCLVFDKSTLLQRMQTDSTGAKLLFAGNVEYRDRYLLPDLGEGDYIIDVDLFDRIGMEAYFLEHLRSY